MNKKIKSRKDREAVALRNNLKKRKLFQKKNKKNIYPHSTSAEQRLKGYNDRLNLNSKSIVKNISFRNIGPTVMSGRVVDLDINPDDPSHFYVAYASGGLWETKNHGNSFVSLFDNQMVMTIGDIKVDWQNDDNVNVWLLNQDKV